MADGVPSVEFLLPFYGDPDLLRETIRSVLEQTDPDWTVTVVDDGYPDPEVEAWIRGLADDRIATTATRPTSAPTTTTARRSHGDPRVHRGARGRRPFGRATSRGRGPCSADGEVDVLHPGVAVIDQHGVVVSPLGDRIKGWLRPGATSTPLRGEQAVRTLMHGNWTYFPSIVWRRSLVSGRGLRPSRSSRTSPCWSTCSSTARRSSSTPRSPSTTAATQARTRRSRPCRASGSPRRRATTSRSRVSLAAGLESCRDGCPDPLDLTAARPDAAPPGTLSAGAASMLARHAFGGWR